MSIILIGMPASGKSTVGVILAKLLGYDFIDTDLLIQRQTGFRLCEIIQSQGLDAFLAVEEAACLSLYANHSVIATGGSVIYSANTPRTIVDGSLRRAHAAIPSICRHYRSRGPGKS